MNFYMKTCGASEKSFLVQYCAFNRTMNAYVFWLCEKKETKEPLIIMNKVFIVFGCFISPKSWWNINVNREKKKENDAFCMSLYFRLVVNYSKVFLYKEILNKKRNSDNFVFEMQQW
jgi:hypothetical protein